MSNARSFHAGCPLCGAAGQQVAPALDPSRYQVEALPHGQESGCIARAEGIAVQSLPVAVIDGQTLHINVGAAIP